MGVVLILGNKQKGCKNCGYGKVVEGSSHCSSCKPLFDKLLQDHAASENSEEFLAPRKKPK